MKKGKPKVLDHILTPEERRKVLNSITNEQEELVIKGLLFTGMRVSEFLHMRKDWIDFKGGLIHIPYRIDCKCSDSCRKAKYKRYKKDKNTGEKVKLDVPVITKPSNTWQCKTKRAARTIPLLPQVKDVLKRHFSEYNSIMDVLFNRINIWRILKDMEKRAKIQHMLFPHMLRATFASVLAELGFDAFMIQSILGWSSITMAQVYVMLSGKAIKDEFNKKWKWE